MVVHNITQRRSLNTHLTSVSFHSSNWSQSYHTLVKLMVNISQERAIARLVGPMHRVKQGKTLDFFSINLT